MINYLMNGDITWLMEQKRTLERDHNLDLMKE